MIECGIDISNPVQISANNMGTTKDVEENVKMLIKAFKPNSNFVFNQVHNIMGDIKPENIVAMLDTSYKESFYGDSS